MPDAPRALDDLFVVDLSTTVAGAWCSRLLADYGADIVLVEPPVGGPVRRLAPFTEDGASITAEYVLANKRSVELDLETAEGRAELARLVARADVVIESGTPGGLARLDAGLDALDSSHPTLIVTSITPHGQTGARAGLPGNDLTDYALSGWASINGLADREPLKGSGFFASMTAGVAAFGATLTALAVRDRDGRGQHVDVSEAEAMTVTFSPQGLRSVYAGSPQRRRATLDMTAGPVPVKDGHFALTISRAHFWRDSMNLLGLTDLAEDHRFDTSWYRQQHKDEYVPVVQERMAQWTKMELFDALATLRVVAGPVLTMPELYANEHLRARGSFVRLDDAPEGPEFPGAPFKMSATPWSLRRRAPRPGEHSAEVHADLDAAPAPSRPAAPEAAPRRGLPLEGLRAIVLTQAWAGALCTELLGLMGAEVIQVEVRKRPDSWRGDYAAPITGVVGERETAVHPWNSNGLFNSVNLNKRSITIDLQTERGNELYRSLVREADIVAENFSPRVMGNLGLSYEQLREIRPDVILASLSAYGHDGPYFNVPGIGGTIEPTSGESALLGYEDGPPLNSGAMIPDPVAGFYGYAAILAAHHHRARTGEGQFIDLSMQEANLTVIGDAALEYTMTGQQRARLGNRSLTFAPHGIYPSAGEGQWIALAAESEAQWQTICEAAGHADWATDARFADNASRKAHEDALDAALATWTREQPRDALAARLASAGVPAAPVLDAIEVMDDPVNRARGVVVEVDHPEAGAFPHIGVPFHLERTPGRVLRHAPLQGQHSLEVFEQYLGMTPAEYDELVAAGISGSGPPD